jgi:FkbM family methyltransferase
LVRRFGYTIRRLPDPAQRDPFRDLRTLAATARPLILDVGANTGQSIRRFRRYFEDPEIHAFEPGAGAYAALRTAAAGLPNVHLVNGALGAQRATRTFIENERSTMSSLLEPGPAAWGAVKRRTTVDLDTIDDYCGRTHISCIDVLKSDTQGYELEVLKGAGRMLAEQRIRLVYIELIFSRMYEGLPRFDHTYAYLADHGFELVSFYDMHYQNDRLSWTDALFAHR